GRRAESGSTAAAPARPAAGHAAPPAGPTGAAGRSWPGTASLQQRGTLRQRQSHDIGIGSIDPGDEGRGAALDCVAAGFPLPLAAADVVLDLAVREAFELHLGGDQPAALLTTRDL